MKIFIRIIGFLAFLLGAMILLWIGYNILIEWQPTAKGNPVLSFLLAILMADVGIVWMQGKTLQEKSLLIPKKFIGCLLILAILYQIIIQIIH